MAAEKPAAPPITLKSGDDVEKMSANERIKFESQGLFYVSAKGEVHTFLDELRSLDSGEAETLSGGAKELSKFFGIYKQQARGDRGKKLKDFFFMVRIKAPGGGGFTAAQWVALDDASQRFADGTIRVTSRQGVQYHHVYGPQLAQLVRHLNREYRDHGTLSACGDVNRNVMGSPIDGLDPAYEVGSKQLAETIAEELAPKTSSYFQIFLSEDEGRNTRPINPEEPLYGAHYLPRKFKIGFAHPTDNSVDVLTQDVGLVPAEPDGSVWDLYTGGGLGFTHNMPKTAALPALYFGRVARDQVVDAVRGIVILQKENGERKDRRHTPCVGSVSSRSSASCANVSKSLSRRRSRGRCRRWICISAGTSNAAVMATTASRSRTAGSMPRCAREFAPRWRRSTSRSGSRHSRMSCSAMCPTATRSNGCLRSMAFATRRACRSCARIRWRARRSRPAAWR